MLDAEDLDAIRIMGFWYWAWCKTGGYRAFMRLAHRYNWHYMPVGGPDHDLAWCQWCGLRDRVIDVSKGPCSQFSGESL
jgi:hypothetical protein